MSQKYIADTEAYIHRKIAGENVLIPVGRAVSEFNGVISMNATAAYIWNAMKEPISREMLIAQMTEEYDIDRETLESDVDEMLGVYLQNGMVQSV